MNRSCDGLNCRFYRAITTDSRGVEVGVRGEKKVKHTLWDGNSSTLSDDHSCDNTTWGHPPCLLSPKTFPSSCHQITVFMEEDFFGLLTLSHSTKTGGVLC